MKDILTAPFMTEVRKLLQNMYRLGWDERNGGNLSYILKEEELTPYLDVNNVIRFLREREIVHFQRFGEALEKAKEKMNQKNVYFTNPAFDR